MTKKLKLILGSKKLRNIIIVGAVLILSFGAGVTVWFVQKKIADANKSAIPTPANGGSTLPKTVVQSQKLASQGKADDAQKKLDDALKNTSDSKIKYELYIQQGVNALNKKDYAKAVAAFHQAEAIKADARITVLLGDTVLLQGDKQLAKTYYNKAIPLIDTNDPRADAEKQLLQNKIQNLGV
jgi:tetratricopeptide (TPR) repeat protein